MKSLLSLPFIAFLARFTVCEAARQCKVTPSDSTWPKSSVWSSELPKASSQPSEAGKRHATYRLEATSVQDVVNAVKFAAKYNIRFNILNSGHDFHGRNDAPNGLVLVIDRLKGGRISTTYKATEKGVQDVDHKSTKIVGLNEAFNGEHAYATIGAGWATYPLNRELNSSGLVSVGANHDSVSVLGGWTQDGGHSPLSPIYGLGADQMVEFKVVTADGIVKVANELTNPDLFWALKGGGGGTFGVVIEGTLKVYKTPKMVASLFFVNATRPNDTTSIFTATAGLHPLAMPLSDLGMSMAYFVYPNAMSVMSVMTGLNGTRKWMDSVWKPKLLQLATLPGLDNETVMYTSFQYNNFADGFNELIVKRKPVPQNDDSAPMHRIRQILRRHGPAEGMDMGPTQSRGIWVGDSWLLAREHLNSPNLATALADSMPKANRAELRGQMVGGPGVFNSGKNTSVLPAWRRAYTHIVVIGESNEIDASALRNLAPDMGAYLNEASGRIPGWKHFYWGENYPKLASIKKEVDPTGVFWVTPGVGADEWTVINGKVCRMETQPPQGVAAKGLLPLSDNPNKMNLSDPKEDDSAGPEFPMLLGKDGAPYLNPQYLDLIPGNAQTPNASTGRNGL